MADLDANPTLPPAPDPAIVRGALPAWLVAAAVIAIAFACREHDPHISLADGYASSPDDISQAVNQGRVLGQVGLALLSVLGVTFLVRSSGASFSIDPLAAGLLALGLGWCCASAVWSEVPGLTLRRLIVLAACLLGALGVARQLSGRQLCLLVISVATTYALVGIATEAILGTLRLYAPGGEYRFSGTMHPNGQGGNCAMLCLACACLWKGEGPRPPWLIFLGLGAFGLLLATKSRTNLGGLTVAVLVLQGVRLTRGTAVAALGVCWLASIGALAIVLVNGEWRPPTEFLLLGRADTEETATLTGRTELWEALDDYMERRPLTGYGYGAFWTPARVEEVSEGQAWGVPTAHSLYYDLVLNVGMIGAGVYLAAVAGFWVRAAVLYYPAGEPDRGLLVGLLVFALVIGVSESAGMDVSFVTFVAACGICRLAFFNPVSKSSECQGA